MLQEEGFASNGGHRQSDNCVEQTRYELQCFESAQSQSDEQLFGNLDSFIEV